MTLLNPQQETYNAELQPASTNAMTEVGWAGSPEVHEKFRLLRRMLIANSSSNFGIAIASVGRSQASTWIASNLACAFAESGDSSLLAFANVDRPRVSLLPTGVNALMDRDFAIRSTRRSHISLLEWKEQDQSLSACASALTKFLPKIQELARILLIDCAPMSESSQCFEMGKSISILVAVDARRDSRVDVRRQTETLKRSGIRVLGAVLYNRERDLPSAIEGML